MNVVQAIRRALLPLAVALTALGAPRAFAAPPVPGHDSPYWARVPGMCDEFEDTNWVWVYNNPKSTMHIDYANGNPPFGYPTNTLLGKPYPFYEDTWCGQPDGLEVVPTPTGGPPGSAAALRMFTTYSATSPATWTRDGISWMTDRNPQGWRLDRGVTYSVNVYVPPLNTWSLRVPAVTNGVGYKFYWGPHIRMSTNTVYFGADDWEWFFAAYLTDSNAAPTGCVWAAPVWDEDLADWVDAVKPISTNGGWWTLGVAAYNNPINGATQLNDVAWFAHPGVAPLTAADFWTHLNYGQDWGDVLSFREFNIGVYTQHGRKSEDWILDNLMMFRPRTPALLRIR